MSNIDLKLIHDELYDLEITTDEKVISICNLLNSTDLAIYVNPSNYGPTIGSVFIGDYEEFYQNDNLYYSSDNWTRALRSGVELRNITKTGFDNSSLNSDVYDDGNYDDGLFIISGDDFYFQPVSGVVTSLNYDATYDTTGKFNSVTLNGGFLQGYFSVYQEIDNPKKIFLPRRFNLGWTVDMVIEKIDSTPEGDTLNTKYPNNSGFIFYLGTRAENKFYSTIPEFVDYKELFDNVFGIRIKDDGTVGYRKITMNDRCDVFTKNLNKFYNFFENSDAVIEENYSCRTVYNNGNTTEDDDPEKANRTNIVITYQRDFALDGCNLIYDPYRKGTLRIYANGVLIYINKDFDEIITRALLTSASNQETVPFNISWGGGSQGLLESVDRDGIIDYNLNKPIEENFAGTYIGKLYEFRMFSRPLNFLEVRNLFEMKRNKYNLDYPI